MEDQALARVWPLKSVNLERSQRLLRSFGDSRAFWLPFRTSGVATVWTSGHIAPLEELPVGRFCEFSPVHFQCIRDVYLTYLDILVALQGTLALIFGVQFVELTCTFGDSCVLSATLVRSQPILLSSQRLPYAVREFNPPKFNSNRCKLKLLLLFGLVSWRLSCALRDSHAPSATLMRCW